MPPGGDLHDGRGHRDPEEPGDELRLQQFLVSTSRRKRFDTPSSKSTAAVIVTGTNTAWEV